MPRTKKDPCHEPQVKRQEPAEAPVSVVQPASERLRKYRERKAAVEGLKENIGAVPEDQLEEQLWSALLLFQDYPFLTANKLKFRYKIRGNEMFVDRKDKSITRATVALAFRNALKLDRIVDGPKKLKTFGASYLYPVFKRLGIILTNTP